MYEGISTVQAPTAESAYIRMLSQTAEEANVLAQEDEIGRVEHSVKELRPNLLCVEAKFISNEGEDESGEAFHLFAAGTHRGLSMIKVQDAEPVEDEAGYCFISKSGRLLLSTLLG